MLEYNWFWSGDKQTDDKAINIKVGQEIHKKSNKNFQKSFQLISINNQRINFEKKCQTAL